VRPDRNRTEAAVTFWPTSQGRERYCNKEQSDYVSNEITGGGGADGGIDIKLYKDGTTPLVQCKHYKIWKVLVHIVREFYGIVMAEHAATGYIVTSGRFTKGAHSFAEGRNIHLIDGRDLAEIIYHTDVSTVTNLLDTARVCPKCSGQFVERG